MNSTDSLINDLRNKYWITRRNAARQLGEIGNPAAVFPLIEALGDDEESVKESAVVALGIIGRPAVMPLINVILDEEKCEIRSEAGDALVRIGKPAVKPLVKVLNNCNDIVFGYVSDILGRIGDPEAVLPLIYCLETGNISVRLDSIEALGKIKDKRAIQPIINDIKKYRNTYGSYLRSIQILIELGEPTALTLLLELLNSEERWLAAELLGGFGKEAVEPLITLLKDKEINNQGIICAALGYTGVKEAIDPLITALGDEDKIISWRAATALVEIGEAAVQPLIRTISNNNKSDYVRILSIHSLGKMGDKRALELLEKLIDNDSSEEIRKVAVTVLERMGQDKAPLLTESQIAIDKDIFVLSVGSERSFSVSLSDDILYLSLSDIHNLRLGDLIPPVPIPYKYSEGRSIPQDFISVDINGFLISDRIKNLFTQNNFTGWKTYPINLYDKSGSLINGYHGFAVTGKVGEIDYSRSEIVAKANNVFGKPEIVKRGIFFDESTMDGNDFMFAGSIILVTDQVVKALRKARPKVKNWEATPASEYELSIFYDSIEPGFLTEEQRNKINELRRTYREEHQQELQRAADILAQEDIDEGRELLHLLKSIVQNGCMFETMSDQSFCQGILMSLSKISQPPIVQMLEALQNKDGKIRAGAAWALGKLKAGEAVDLLLLAIKDKEEDVRREAVIALGEISDKRAVMPLIKVLEEEDSAYVRSSAATGLGAISDQRSIQPLISILNNEDEVHVLGEIALALGKLGATQAIFPLIELFKNEDSNLAEYIKCALVQIGKPTVIPLIQSLNNNNPLIRRGAAKTLGEIGEKSAVLSLIEQLSLENDPEILTFVVEALGKLGDLRAVKPILKIAQSVTIEYLLKEIQIALKLIQEKNKVAGV
ncbi:MAG: HEAT repeat domain-containing protein [Bacillota bacterium]|jgi:HEAT repeat protein